MNRAVVVLGAVLFLPNFINFKDFMYLYILMFHFISYFNNFLLQTRSCLLQHCNIYIYTHTPSQIQPEDGSKKPKNVADICKFIKYLIKKAVLDSILLQYFINMPDYQPLHHYEHFNVMQGSDLKIQNIFFFILQELKETHMSQNVTENGRPLNLNVLYNMHLITPRKKGSR